MRDYTELEGLQSHYSDYHKDFYGFRPRSDTDEQWNSIEWLTGAIQRITDEMTKRESTFEGREWLRTEGWCPPAETDPELIERAAASALKRKQQYDQWVAGRITLLLYSEEME